MEVAMRNYSSNSNRGMGKKQKRRLYLFMTQIVLKFLMILCAVVSMNVAIAAESELKHPIDIWLQHCNNSNPTTAGMNTCTAEAINKWDKEMNKVYKELMSRLSEKKKTALKKSQVAWLKYRDEEYNFLDNFYSEFQGTMWSNILMGEKLSILKQRTLTLQFYLQNLKEN
jgi:uncharacterized protein YecT (DUF1311 family)